MSLRIIAASTALCLGIGAAVLGTAAPAAAGQVGHLVYTTPGTTTWTVPAGVNGAIVTVDGAAGGSETTYLGTTTLGGKGGEVTGFVPLSAGQTVGVYVGGAGQNVQGFYNTYVTGGAGGYNGGGIGGSADDPGAGGGGASWVLVDGTPVLVGAGGGGGTGSWIAGQQSAGGNGGGFTGADGSIIDTQSQYGPARGGTQSQGGAAGLTDWNTGETPGSYGIGGHGGSSSTGAAASSGGAGGGGGWYGGGGGGASGGAGGSSYVSPLAFNTTTTPGVKAGNGTITIDYGATDAVTIDQNPVPHATAGAAYSHTFTATGWPAASFTPVGGTLPAGLQLSADGVLSGTLTAAGTYDFEVGAYNAVSFIARDVHLVVDPGAPATLTAGVDSPTGGSGTVEAGGYAPLVAEVKDAYGNAVPGNSVRFALPVHRPWTFVGGGKTVLVSRGADGRATANVALGADVGTFKATVTATDTALPAVTDQVTVVPSQPGMDGGGPQPGGLLNKPYDDALTVFGVPAPTVTVHAGSLPPGLTLSGTHISGTPTATGTFSFTLRVDNGAPSGPVDVPCTITITRTPSVGILGGGINPGTSGLHALPLPVTLSAPSAVPATVHWATRAGSAKSPGEFRAAHGTVTIPAGDSSATVTVWVHGHVPGRGTKTFSVVLSSPTNARLDAANRIATCSIFYG